jgi:hypothetical protein
VDLLLHRVNARGHINLSGLVAEGVEFYSAIKDEGDGSITLHPVRVATTVAKRGSVDDEQPQT